MGLFNYSETASANTAVNGVNIGEGMARADVNNAMREIMADLATYSQKFRIPPGTTNPSSGQGLELSVDNAGACVVQGFNRSLGSYTPISLSGYTVSFRGPNGIYASVDPNGYFQVYGASGNSSGITGSGNFRVTAQGPSYGITVANPGTGAFTAMQFVSNGVQCGSIVCTTTATAYNTSSDYRLKENVAPITNAATRLLALKPSRFNFTASPGRTVDGFLAHEVQVVIPECVTGEKDAFEDVGSYTENKPVCDDQGDLIGYDSIVHTEVAARKAPEGSNWVKTGTRPLMQSIDQSKMVPLVVAALQEALQRIAVLEARV